MRITRGSWRTRGGLLLLLVAATAVASTIWAGPSSAAAYPHAAYVDTAGVPICDLVGDQSPSYSDVACNSTDEASSYVGSDGTDATVAFVLRDDPRSSSGQAPLASNAYVVAIGVNGVQAATIGVDAKGTGDSDYVYTKCEGDPTLTFSQLFSAAQTAGDASVTTEPGPEGYYRIAFSFPVSALAACGITASTPVQLFYGTSQAGNLDVINKDHFRGDAVDFAGLATITFGGGLTVAKTATVVSGPNPPTVNQTTTYALAVTAANRGLYTVSALSVVDSLPAGVSIVSTTATEGSVATSGQSVTWSGVVLIPGEDQTLTIRVSVTPTSADIGAPLLLNPGATATGSRVPDSLPLTASSNAVSTGPVDGALVTVTKTVSPTAVNPGDTVTYTIILTNSGTAPADVDSVADALPASFTYVPSSSAGTLGAGDPSIAGQQLTWSGPFAVPVGASRTLRFDVVASAPPASWTNTASAAGTNFTPDSSGPTASVVVNAAPEAVDDDASTPEDTAAIVPVAVNDLDPDSTLPLDSISIMSPPNHGTAAANDDGTVTYTPAANYNGPDSFNYRICDSGGLCDTAAVTVAVTPVNDGPSLNDDGATGPEDAPISVDVLANDADPEGDTLTVTAATPPASGTVAVQPDGTVVYTPASNFAGSDGFAYTACDSGGACASAEVTITVLPVNDAPVAASDSGTTSEDTPFTLDVAANDADVDGNLAPATVTILAGPTLGSTETNGDGTVTYTPAADYSGPDSFTYRICDSGGLCDTAIVSITVGPGNDAPVAVSDSSATVEDGPVVIDVLNNDGDPDGDMLTVTAVTQPSAGAVAINADGTVTYTPEPDTNGTDTFTYTACDAAGACDTATVTVTVTPVNDPPAADPDTAASTEDGPVIIDVAPGDTDPDGDALTITAISDPSSGTAAVQPDGTILYTPDPDFNGTDAFTYVICDGDGACDSGTVTVTVTAVNDAPVAGADTATTQAGQPVAVPVLDDDVDADGDPLTLESVADPDHGTATAQPDGTVLYTPDPEFIGDDPFTYSVCDDNGACTTGTVVVSVTPPVPFPPAPPVAADDLGAGMEDTPLLIAVSDNDTDPDGDLDASSVRIVDPPAHGTAAPTPAGGVTYVPDPDFSGADGFRYEVCDTGNRCSTAEVTISIAPAGDGPVAGDDVATTGQDEAVDVTVLANDSDVDGDLVPGSVHVTTAPDHGTAGSHPDGHLTYAPDHGYAGTDHLTYAVCDSTGACARAQVTVTVVASQVAAVTPPVVSGATSLIEPAAGDTALAGGWIDAILTPAGTNGGPSGSATTAAPAGTGANVPRPAVAVPFLPRTGAGLARLAGLGLLLVIAGVTVRRAAGDRRPH